VENYSGCGLTKESDKLVALSGVAAYFKDMLQDDYLAGLWKANLPSTLLWSVWPWIVGDGTSTARPLKYRAPSWSWAAIDGTVSYDNTSQMRTPIATVVDAMVGLRSGNITGGVISGHIAIKGRLLSALWTRKDNMPFGEIVLAHETHVPEGLHGGFPDILSDVTSDEIYLLPIYLPKTDSIAATTEASTRGLILRPIEAPSKMDVPGQCFRRVGTFFFNHKCCFHVFDYIPDTLVYIF
jgi:hypothetical protein